MRSLRLSDEDVFSPATALSNRQAWEDNLTAAYSSAVEQFLATSLRHLDEDTYPSQSRLNKDFSMMVQDVLDQLDADDQTLLAIRASIEEDDLAEEVYATAHALTNLQPSDRRAALREALSFETPSVALRGPDPYTDPAELTAGIGDMFSGLRSRGASWASRTRTRARTTTTRAFNSTSLWRLKRLSRNTHKRWITRRDANVRPTHADADGQTVPLNSPFWVGGTFMDHPGDRNAEVGEVVNCRCVMVGVRR